MDAGEQHKAFSWHSDRCYPMTEGEGEALLVTSALSG